MKLVKFSSLITIDQLHVQLLLSIAFDEEIYYRKRNTSSYSYHFGTCFVKYIIPKGCINSVYIVSMH